MSEIADTSDAYEMIKTNGQRLIEATHVATGIRTRFRAISHFDIGQGWYLSDVDGVIDGVITDKDICYPARLTLTRAEAVAQDRWSNRVIHEQCSNDNCS